MSSDQCDPSRWLLLWLVTLGGAGRNAGRSGDTEMSATAFQDGGRERIAASILIGCIATAEVVAGPVVFLCSGLSWHVTGEIRT